MTAPTSEVKMLSGQLVTTLDDTQPELMPWWPLVCGS
jgi:hypothetical protein